MILLQMKHFRDAVSESAQPADYVLGRVDDVLIIDQELRIGMGVL